MLATSCACALLFIACGVDDDARTDAVARRSSLDAHLLLADGAWTVIRRLHDGGALLVRNAPAPDSVLLRRSDGRVQPLFARTLELTLPGVPVARARPLRVGVASIDGVDVVFPLRGASPPLLPSPVDPGFVVFEEADAIWRLDPDGAVRRLTATSVGGFDFDSLAARQSEGRVILYWAAAPIWSPDGRTLAYATNREAVATDTSGQAIWLLAPETGTERPLLAERGRSFRPIGWLGGDVLFIGDEPGVWRIDPVRGDRFPVASGVAIDVARGSAVALAEHVPDSTTVRVLERNGDEYTVPPAPDGFVYHAQGSFAPGDARLLLEASADSGRTRRWLVFHLESRVLQSLPRLSAGDDRPQWVDDRTLLVNATDAATGRPRAFLVPVVPAGPPPQGALRAAVPARTVPAALNP